MSQVDPEPMPSTGVLQPGPGDRITDVGEVAVGHCTLADGACQTGVTVVVPHPGDLFLAQTPAAVTVLNGFGKSAGLVQIQELGVLETPIALTNTFAVGAVLTAQVRQTVAAHPEIGRDWPTVNSLVLECNDGYLNDLQAMAVTGEHYLAACGAASGQVEQGAVGAGPDGAQQGDQGTIIMVLATDAPLDARQLRRLSLRAGAGLARTGSCFGHGSGDIALAFTTAYTIPQDPAAPMPAVALVHEALLDPLFQATAEATEQAIRNGLWHADTVAGRDGHIRLGLRDWLRGATGA